MSMGRAILKLVCATASALAICSGSVAAIAPAFAVDGDDSGAQTNGTITDATLSWSLNKESNYRAYAPGTFNFLSAGIIDKTTADDAITEDEWKQQDGNVAIEKRQSDGTYAPATWAGLSTTPEGKPLPSASAADGEDSGNRVTISKGEGTFDADKDDASISWTGSFTVAYYSGLTQWYATDLKLEVVDGQGTLTATLGGWATDMNDSSVFGKLDEQTGVEIATLRDVDVQDGGLIVTPEFAEIDVNGQGTKVRSWPKPFIEFVSKTGAGSYWYGSGGNADQRKAPASITVSWGEGGEEPSTGRLPGAPTITNHDNPGTDRVELFWQAPEDVGDPALVGFVVSATAQDGGDRIIGSFSAESRSGVLDGLKSATTYEVTIAAVNASGIGPVSEPISITTASSGSGDGGDNNNGGNGGGDNNSGDGDGGDSNGDTIYKGVTLRWGMNDETNSAAYAGGCNFLSAGVAGNTGASKVWDQSFYKSSDGNVTIQKPDANGDWVTASWDSKCLTRDGDIVKMGKRADGRSINTESQVVFSGGTGTVKQDGSVTVSWKGSWTVAYYGGMTYWTITDPTLTLDANGEGSLTATASGYGADMNDASKWETLEAKQIHVADFTGGNAVNVRQAATDRGFSATPDYLGVAVSASGDHGSQAAKDSANAAYWGSFPQSFVDYQIRTGQSAYWYTSNSQRDFAKPTLPLYVQYNDSYQVDAGDGSPDASTVSGAVKSGSSGSTGTTAKSSKSGTTTTNKAAATPTATDDAFGDTAAADDGSTLAEPSAETPMLIADNAATIAIGSGSVAVASALPLGVGWFIRRRLGLDASAELDKRLGL